MSNFEWRIYRAHIRKMCLIFFGIGLVAGAFIGFVASLVLK